MTEILKDISTYDIENHTPYPTLGFIKQETGEDLISNQGNEQRAIAFVKQVTDISFSILKQSKDTLDTINRLEYLIATDEEYRLLFLNYVCKVIYAMFTYGADFLEKNEGINGLPSMVKSYVLGSKLSLGKWVFDYKYRVGY